VAKINWANLALDDLRSIYDYVAQDSQKYADRLIENEEEIGIVRVHHSRSVLKSL
jgi:plasmid stabilization system protein ParE